VQLSDLWNDSKFVSGKEIKSWHSKLPGLKG